MYFLILSVLTITDPGSILVDDRLLESQKHWMTCKMKDFESELGVSEDCFCTSTGLDDSTGLGIFAGLLTSVEMGGFCPCLCLPNAVFLVTISYLFQSVILSNSIVSATLRDDIFVSIVTCFISWVLVIIRNLSIMLCSFTFSYF